MNNNFEADAIETAPELSSLTSHGYPTNGNPGLGIPATLPGAAWFHMITEELRNAIVAAGIDPDHEDASQLAAAIKALISSRACPTGSLVYFAGSTIPDNFLLCNGAAVSRTDYAELFAVIGTLYGAGDSSTTFNLPDFRGRVPQGADSNHALGAKIAAGLPNITGVFYSRPSYGNAIVHTFIDPTGAFKLTDVAYSEVATIAFTNQKTTKLNGVSFSASNSNSIYNNNVVQPSAVASYVLIKT